MNLELMYKFEHTIVYILVDYALGIARWAIFIIDIFHKLVLKSNITFQSISLKYLIFFQKVKSNPFDRYSIR